MTSVGTGGPEGGACQEMGDKCLSVFKRFWKTLVDIKQEHFLGNCNCQNKFYHLIQKMTKQRDTRLPNSIDGVLRFNVFIVFRIRLNLSSSCCQLARFQCLQNTCANKCSE